MSDPTNPHGGQPVLAAGAPLAGAKAAMIMVHGRGANAADILGLADAIGREDIACLAPEAAGHAWYPQRFIAPVAMNQPYLASALGVIGRLVAACGESGIPPERVALLGFSQGACLSVEFAARHPRRYGAVFALTGGLIGERIEAADYTGSLAGTPVFIGSGDADPHIPLARVRESTAILRGLGAEVTERIYPGLPHTVIPDEIAKVRRMLDAMLA
ncbi:dienelactone hydrolase family protein [soil metagenome]